MVTKREKMRNRFLESKRDVFHYQSAILRSQSGRKLNARDYQAIVSAHRQSPSVYDDPDAVVRTARIAEALAGTDDWEPITMDPAPKAADGVKRAPKSACGRPRVKGHRPGQPGSAASSAVSVKKRLPSSSSENPYAKPTYRSFEWLLPRRRSSTDDALASAVKRKRRRNLFAAGDASSSSLGKDSASSVLEDGATINSSCTDTSSVCRLFVDVAGTEITSQGSSEPPNKSPGSPTGSVEDRRKTRTGDFVPGNASPTHRDKNVVCVNGIFTGGSSESLTSQLVHEPCSSTPLKRSPLHPAVDETPVSSNHVSSNTSSPRSSTHNTSSPRFSTLSKLNSRHFSDILVTDRTYPPSTSRARTTSQNSEDAYIDVVSDAPAVSAASARSMSSPQRNSPRNGFADGLARLSKVRAAKKHLSGDGLMNGLRQGTLDGFLRRGVPNGANSRCLNGMDVADSVAVTENKHLDLNQHRSPSSSSSVRLMQSAVDRVTADGETCCTLDCRMEHGDGGDNSVDMDSIEGVWRRRTSLRSSTAFMNLLGPDVAELT